MKSVKGSVYFILAYQQEFSIQINFYVENFPLNNRNFPTNSTKADFCDVPRSDPVLDGLDMNLLKGHRTGALAAALNKQISKVFPEKYKQSRKEGGIQKRLG